VVPLLGAPGARGPRFIEPPEPPVPTPLKIWRHRLISGPIQRPIRQTPYQYDCIVFSTFCWSTTLLSVFVYSGFWPRLPMVSQKTKRNRWELLVPYFYRPDARPLSQPTVSKFLTFLQKCCTCRSCGLYVLFNNVQNVVLIVHSCCIDGRVRLGLLFVL